ncbi:MAG: hypothetical protein ACE5OR_05415, partial [bacterium]
PRSSTGLNVQSMSSVVREISTSSMTTRMESGQKKTRHPQGLRFLPSLTIRKEQATKSQFSLDKGVWFLILTFRKFYTFQRTLKEVGNVVRVEAANLVIGYEFDLRTNNITAKTIPNPAAGKEHLFVAYRIRSDSDKEVNLITNSQQDRALCSACEAINDTRYDATYVTCDTCSHSYNPQSGNVTGAVVECDRCHERFRLVDRMNHLNGPLKYRRYAKIILTNGGEKRYSVINEFDKQLEEQIRKEFKEIIGSFPVVPVEPGYNTNQMLKHNYSQWIELFSDRQLVCIHHLIDAIKQIQKPELRLLFACLFSGTLEFNNLFTSFKGEGTGAVRHMFSHHVLKPELMPLEANLWGTSRSSGSFSTLFRSRVETALAYKADPSELRIDNWKSTKVHRINNPISVSVAENFHAFQDNTHQAYLSEGDSSCTDIQDKSIFTYHHSRHEGWISVHRAIRHGGFSCVQAHPIKSERSVSMPLQQAKTPMHLDLILVCKKEEKVDSAQQCQNVLTSALDMAKEQIGALSSAGIKVSLGDAKVVLMGQLLRHTHAMLNLEMEERFLSDVEREIDIYVGQVMEAKGEVLYTQQKSEQLMLFEEMGEYLANKSCLGADLIK